ncbi:MAG TPA: prolipoprotein diacylglyceryl transferase [Phycisphaerae bacterium]|nr:prolipoprotein diacylglyceryl transferase [Phycisphaerae bacterium]
MLQIIIDLGTFELLGRSIPLRIFGYGLMLVMGFLCGITLARWRARRAGESADAITTCGILALIGGVVGARLAYVLENWRNFLHQKDVALEILNVTSGGLIYYGGVALATAMVLIYLRAKRLPVRRYLDIIAPSMMIGLAFGRAGCLLNGCCHGGPCDAHWALATRFPLYSEPLVKLNGPGPFSDGTQGASPPYAHQLETGRVHPDSRLTYVVRVPLRDKHGRDILSAGRSQFKDRTFALPPRDLHGRLTNDQLAPMLSETPTFEKDFYHLAGADGLLSEEEWRRGIRAGDGLLRGSEAWEEARTFDDNADGTLSPREMRAYLDIRLGRLLRQFDADHDGQFDAAERAAVNEYLQADLYEIAHHAWSEPVRPAQALGIVNALLLAGLLLAFSRLRTREGQVFLLMVLLYPVTRFVLESIRADNPHNLAKGILTHNQYTSIVLVAAGIVLLFVLRILPASCGPTLAQRVASETGKPRGKSRQITSGKDTR